MSDPGCVTLSLVSHTNVGKTTLARTLLRRDVGEVRDEAHVTEVSEAYELIATGPARLRLFDTPGLGDTARLLGRLRGEGNPLGWLLGQVWDRVANRPFWCTQQAMRTIRAEADVILYLVSAGEAPEEAGYVRHELDLLGWVRRPVLVLLNQTGPARPREGPELEQDAGRALEERWRAYVRPWPIVHDVLSLDAFTRCWVHEGVLFERIAAILPEAKRGAMRACLAAWNARHEAVFRGAVARMARHLAEAAADREPLAGAREDAGGVPGLDRWTRRRARAMHALRARLRDRTRALVDGLIVDHGLDGHSTVELRQRLEDFDITGAGVLTPAQGAAVGGVVSGALGGLAADLLAGGLSFGAGVVAGALLGALGGAGLTRAYRLAVGPATPAIGWSPAFLRDLVRQTVLRYLAVAHFGRGRGGYQDVELPAAWREIVDRTLAPLDPRFAELWPPPGSAPPPDAVRRLSALLEHGVRGVLVTSYPEAGPLLEGPGDATGRVVTEP